MLKPSKQAAPTTAKHGALGDFPNATQFISALSPIHRLPQHAIGDLLKQGLPITVAANESISEMIQDSAFVHYLIQGTLVLKSGNQVEELLQAGDAKAKKPLERRNGGANEIVARSACILARFSWDILENHLINYAPGELSSTLEVKEILSTTCSDWMVRLLQSDLFSILPAANIQQVLSGVENIDVLPDEKIITQGDKPDHFYIIEGGSYSVFREVGNPAREVGLAELKTGDFFGEEALITGGLRGTSVKATSTGKLLKINGDTFKKSILEPTIQRVENAEANELLNNGARLVDVRETELFEQESIPGSENLVLKLLRINSNRLDKDQSYVVASDLTNAAAVAAFLLRVRGFDAVCLNSPVLDYAKAFKIETTRSTAQDPTTQTDQKIMPSVEHDAGVDSLETAELSTFAKLAEIDSKHEIVECKPAKPQDYAHTVVGMGLAGLIDELNDSHDEQCAAEDAAGETGDLSDIQSKISDPDDFDLVVDDTIESLAKYQNAEIATSAGASISGIGNTAEFNAKLAAAIEDIKTELSKELEDNIRKQKQAAAQIVQAHKAKLEQQFAEKRKALVANSKRLIALANKISQQKAEVEKARKELAAQSKS